MASNVQDNIDPENSTNETQSSCEDGRHEDPLGAAHEDVQDSPGKILIQSVTDILVQSAQSVRALVSGNITTPTTSVENEEEDKPMQSAQLVKDAVGSNSDGYSADNEHNSEEEKILYLAVRELRIDQPAQCLEEAVTGSTENEEEKTLYQAVGERIAQSAQSMKEAVAGNTENGEEKTVLQAVGEKLVKSAKTVKDAVKGDVHIIPGEDEAAEHSILVHTALD